MTLTSTWNSWGSTKAGTNVGIARTINYDVHDRNGDTISLTGAETVIMTVNITTVGGPVLVVGSGRVGFPSDLGSGQIQLKRNGSVISQRSWVCPTSGTWRQGFIHVLDNPPAGSYTYTYEATELSGVQEIRPHTLAAYELRFPIGNLNTSAASLAPEAGAINVPVSASWTEILSTNITTDGYSVFIGISSGVDTTGTTADILYRITRDGSPIAEYRSNDTHTSSSDKRSFTRIFVDESPAAATYTYALESRVVSGSSVNAVDSRQIYAIELVNDDIALPITVDTIPASDPATEFTTSPGTTIQSISFNYSAAPTLIIGSCDIEGTASNGFGTLRVQGLTAGEYLASIGLTAADEGAAYTVGVTTEETGSKTIDLVGLEGANLRGVQTRQLIAINFFLPAS